MRVLLTGSIHGTGGIQTHLRYFIRTLDEEGHDVTILTAKPWYMTEDNDVREEFGFPVSDRLTILETTDMASLQKFFFFRKTIREFKPDILITIGHGLGNLMLAFLLPKKTPSVYFEVMIFEGKLSITNARKHYPRVFSHFVAQSPTVGEKLCINFDRQVEYTSIPAISQIHEDSTPLPEIRERKHGDGKIRVCYFGRIVTYKQPDLLIKRFEDVEDIVSEYHVYGTGTDPEIIIDNREQSPYKERIFYHGNYPAGSEYYELLAGFDLLVLPTIGSEGTPLVLMEAMACGVPWVSCDSGGIRDFIYPENHCYLATTEEDDVVAGVRTIAERILAGEISGKKIQDNFLRHYGFNSLKKKWLDEIDRILEDHRKK